MASGGRLAGRQRLWLAGAEKDWRDYLDVILDLISNMGEWRLSTPTPRSTRLTRPRSRLQEGFTHLRNAARDPALSSVSNSVAMPRRVMPAG